MHFWPVERQQEVRALDFADLGVYSEDLQLIERLKEDVEARHVLEHTLTFLTQFNPIFGLSRDRDGQDVSRQLKNEYREFFQTPVKALPHDLSRFVQEMCFIFEGLSRYGIRGFSAENIYHYTLFDWFDRYESLLKCRPAFERGTYVRFPSFHEKPVPVGKPFLPSRPEEPRTLEQAIRHYAPGYNPILQQYRRHTGFGGDVLDTLGLNKPLKMDIDDPKALQSFLSALDQELYPQLEEAIGHYISVRSMAILDNLLAVRKEIDAILQDQVLSSAHRQLGVEAQLVTGFLESRQALHAFAHIRYELSIWLEDLREQAGIAQRLLAQDSSELPGQELLLLKGLFTNLSTILYPNVRDRVDIGLHHAFASDQDSSYQPSYRDARHSQT